MSECRCGRPATWIYTNGNYRRFECDRHAEETRRVLRHYSSDPREPRLTLLADLAALADEVSRE